MNINNPGYWNEKYKKIIAKELYEGNHKILYDTIVKTIINPNGNILDIGCGNGAILYTLSKEQRKKYNGCDFSLQGITQIRENFPEVNSLQTSNCDDLRFPGNKFTTIIISEVFEHLSENIVFKTLAEIFRVLKFNGQLIISVPYVPDGRIKHREHLRAYKKHELKELMMAYVQSVKIEVVEKWFVMSIIKGQ